MTTPVRYLKRCLSRPFSVSTFVRKADASHSTPTETSIPGFRAPGQVATNWEIATGAERYEYLKKLQGEDPWEEMNPIYLTEPGTKEKPIVLKGVDPERYIGCTGFPADSHEVVWLTLRPRTKGFDRCPHCGNVFKYIQEEHHEH